MVSDEKLNAVAAAAGRVAEINENYRRQMAASSAPEEQSIVAEAKAELVKAVTEQGLTVEEYNAIIDAAEKDPDISSRILERLGPTED